ncbi:MAG: hypothetical protein ACRCYQ_04370 [Nocardioides sp.]
MAGPADPRGLREWPDFVPGNTRLRARLGALSLPGRWDREDLSLGELDTRLRSSGLASRGEHGHGDRRHSLLLGVDAIHRETLRSAISAYQGVARDMVGVLFSCYDQADLLTLVRASARGIPAGDVLPMLDSVGELDRERMRSALADDPGVTLGRVAATSMVGPATAHALRDGLEAYDRTGDLAGWETRVVLGVAADADGRLAEWGRPARPIARYLAGQRDQANLLAALQRRLHERTVDAGPWSTAFLPGGTISVADVARIAGGDVSLGRLPVAWQPCVQRFLATQPTNPGAGLERLARELEDLRFREASSLVVRGDPLGAEVAVGYLARAELRTRTLRRAVQLATDNAVSASAAGPSTTTSGAHGRDLPTRRHVHSGTTAPEDGWPADLLVVVPPWLAPGFRLAGTRVRVAAEASGAVAEVQDEVVRVRPGVVAVHAGLWAEIPPSVRHGWEELRHPLVLSLPDESAQAASARRDRVRELLARSVGYEIAFLPEGES